MQHSGALWNTLGSLMFSLNTLLMGMIVSRYLGVALAGDFGIALTTAQILYIVGIFGMNAYQMTDYAEKYDFWDYCGCKIITSILMMVCCAAVVLFSSYDTNKNLLTVLLTVFMLTNSVAELFQSMFFQKNRLDLSGKSLFYRTFFSLLFYYLTVVFYKNLLLALVVMILANLVAGYFVTLKPAYEFKKIPFHISRSRILSLLKENLPLFSSLFLMTFLYNCSKYVIEHYENRVVQGYYNIILTPALSICLISGFIFKPLWNSFAQYIERNEQKEFVDLLKKQLFIIFGWTLIGSAFVYLIGRDIMGLLFKLDLSSFRWELTATILGGGFFAVSELLHYLLVILRKQMLILAVYLLNSAFSIGISVVLISKFGLQGGILSFVISLFILACSFFATIVYSLKGKEKCDR